MELKVKNCKYSFATLNVLILRAVSIMRSQTDAILELTAECGRTPQYIARELRVHIPTIV